MKFVSRVSCFLILAMLSSALLADQTVRFRVPVKLNKLYSDVKSFSIGCRITKSTSPATSYAYSRKDINILGQGKYNGIVEVAVKVPDSISTQVDYWVCEVYLFRVSAANGCKPSYSSAIPACKAKPGSQLVIKVQGKLSSLAKSRNQYRRVSPTLRR